jgi:hypothetical protein
MDELVHLSHGGSNLLLAGVGTTVVLSILLNGALGLSRLSVLGRDENSVDLGGNNRSIGELVIGDGDLGLSIGTKPPERSIFTNIGELLSELVGKEMGQRHAALGLIGGVSKHNTLVTGSNVKLVLSNVNSSSNIGRLLVDTNKNLASITRETLGLNGRKIVNERAESNLTNLIADNLLVVEMGGSGDLSKDHHHVVLRGGLTCDLGHGIGGKACVKDGIRHLVTKLIRVSFVDGLGREEERACFDHG